MLDLVAQSGVESLGTVVFYLYFNVRDAAPGATFVCCSKEGLPDALAPGFGADVEVFDCGEERGCGDVGAVGEDGHAGYLALDPCGQYLDVSVFDGPAQAFGEDRRQGLAVP